MPPPPLRNAKSPEFRPRPASVSVRQPRRHFRRTRPAVLCCVWLCHAAAAAAQNPVVTFSHGSASLSESETTISGTVTANPPPQTTLTVRYSVTDFRDFVTASHEGDKTITFSANQATAQLTVPIVNDLTDEPNGDVRVALKTGSGYTLGSATGTTFKVVDNDSTSVRLRRTGPEDIDEGEETTFTVALGRKLVAGETVTAPLTVAAKYAIRRKSVTDDDYSITLKSGSGVSLITSTPYTAAQPAVTFTGSDTGTVQVATLTLAAMADGVDENSFETLAVGLGTVTSNLDRLATGTGTTGTAASGSGSVVIWSYDTTVISIAAGASPVTEGANASFTVSADPPPVVDLVVDLKVTDHPGSDFVAAEDEGAKTVTIAAGGASATYTVATQADSIDEPNGVAEVMLVGTIRYNVRSPHTVGVDVNDDDATSVTLAGAAGDVTEGGAKSITLTLGRGLVSGEVLAVPLTFGGTATRGTDYTVSGASGTGLSYQNLNSGSAGVTFTGPASGATATVATLTLTAETDQAAEPAGETVDIGLGTLNASTGTGLGGGASGTDNLASFSIEDPPGNAVNLSVSAGGAASEGGAALTVTATLDRANASGAAISIPIQVRTTGTTGQASDYTVASSIGIADDARSGSTSFSVTDDRIDEDAETVVLELGAALPPGVVPGKTTAVTVTIADNDTADLVFSRTSLGLSEGGDVSYTVKLATQPTGTVTVAIAVPAGADLTLDDASLEFTTSTWNDAQTVTVDAGEDPDAAADTATLTHTASGGGYNGVSADLAVTVTDDDTPGLVLSPTSLDVDEGGDASYTVKLATQPTGTVTVAIAVPAGAGLTLDDASLEFTTSTWNDAQTVTVDAGEDPDTTDDTATLTHTASGGGYSVTASLAVTVNDDDTLPVVSFASSSSSASEAAGTRNVTVNLSPAPTAATTSLSYTVGGTATAGSDFSIAGSGRLSVSSGAATASIPVAITDDTADESNETVLLTLTPGSGYTVGSANRHTLTITDNDGVVPPPPPPPTVSLSASPNPVDEGQSVTVTARLSAALSGGVTIPLTLTAGTAEAGDYGSLASIAISGGQTVGTGTVTTAQDADTADETFTVALGTLPSDVTAGTPSSVQVTIRDDDEPPPAVSLSASPNPVTEGGSVTVTARLSAALSGGVTIPLTLTAGTAEAGDYGSLASIAISGGQTVGTGTVTTAQDADTADETFTVALGTLPSDVTAGTPSSVQVTIRDDDEPPPTVSLSASPNPVDEGQSVTVTARLSAALSGGVTIPLTLTAGTAEAGDYGSLASIAISGGQTVGTGTVTTAQDADTADETFTVALGTLPSDVTAGTPSSVQVTIRDDDEPPPTVSLSASPNPVDEGQSVTVTARLSAALSGGVTIPLTLTAGTAEAGDYGSLASIAISGGQTVGTGTVTTAQDADTADETFTVALGTLPSDVTAGTPSSVQVTIRDDDEPPPTVSLSASPNPVDEGQSVTVTARLSAALSGGVTIPLTLTAGTAEAGDYGSLASIAISGGQTVGTGTVTTAQDADTADETFTVALGTLPSDVTAGTPSSVQVTIRDDDEPPPTVSLSASPNPVTEGGSVTVTARLSAALSGGVTIPLTLTAGTAEAGDYGSLASIAISGGQTVGTGTVTTAQDADTADETFTVALGTLPSDVTAGTPSSVQVTIRDDDEPPPTVSLSASPNPVDEGQSVTVTARLSAALSGGVTIPLTLTAGTAEAGDYGSLASIAISGGQTVGTGTVTTAQDADTADETFTVALGTLPSDVTAGTPSSVQVTIRDDDEPPPTVSLSASPNPVDEGQSVTVTARLSAALSGGVTIPLTLTAGTAEAGDYGSLASIAISGGQTVGTGTVTTAQDADTADETFTVALGTLPSDVTAGTPSSVQVTIRDDDEPPPTVSLSASPNPVDEGQSVTVTARLSAALSGGVTIPLTLTAGTAEAGDYGSLASITISGGQTVGTGTVTTAQDADTADETFTVALGTLPSDVTAGSPSSVAVTIRDDDEPPTPSVSIANAAPLEEGRNARFSVTLSAVSPQMVTVSYATRDGTAAAGSDYRAMEGTLRFSPGVRHRTILVPTMDDEQDEPAETFMVELSNPVGATLAKRMGMATLNDNDDRVNRPPAASASCEPCSVPPSGAVHLTATASDPDGDPLTYVWSASAGRFAGPTRRSTARWTAPAETGRVTIRVRVSDGAGGSVSAAVTVQVVNRAPAFERSVYRFELAENLDGRQRPVDLGQVAAEDPDGDGLTYEVASGDRERFRIGARDGAVRYVGAGEDFETEPNRHDLTVRARDSSGAEAETRVVVTVGDVNEGPAAADDTAETLEDQAVTVDVLANDTDPDGDGLRVESVSAAAHGRTRVASGGGVTYTPAAQYHGVDRFTYVVSDADGLTATAAVKVTVRSANDAPAAVGVIPDQPLDATVGSVDVDLAPFFDDADGDTLTYRALSSDPDVATAMVGGAVLTLTPAARGSATVTVTAEDPGGLTAVQTFSVGVDNRLERAGLGNTLAAMARSHLASARMTLGRRMTAGGGEGSRLTVMGRAVPLGKAAARRAAEQMATGWLSSAAWSGMSAQGPGGSPFGVAGATPGFGAYPTGGIGGPAPGGPALGGLGLGGPMAVGMPPASTGGLPGFGGFGGGSDALLRGTEFELALGGGEAGEARSGGRWGVWGQGDVQAFQGAPTALGDEAGYAGDVWTSYLGVDARLTERWLVGMAVSRSAGDADWRVGASRGRLRTNLTALHPYVQWSDGTKSVWAMAGGGWGDGGAGEGEAENLRETTGRVGASGLGLRLGLVEYRERVGEAGFGLRADAAWAELRTGAGRESVDGLLATVNQQRLGVEIARRGRLGALALQPFGEAHLRRDGGAGQVGTGLEVAFGLGLTGGPVRLDVQGRALAVHSAVGYRERGASLTLTVGGQEREGLSLSVSPRWGDAASGAGALWQEEVYRHYLPETAQDAFAVDARGGYGMRLPNDGLLTWFGSYRHSPHGRSFVVGGSIDGLVDALLRRA